MKTINIFGLSLRKEGLEKLTFTRHKGDKRISDLNKDSVCVDANGRRGM